MSSSSSSSAAGVPQSAAASPPSALPTDEALEVLLGPDGYYRYLGVAKPEPDAMGPKYQAAAMAAGAGGGSGSGGSGIDLDQVKKNYRRLSLRHHPDRKTGDAEAFRVLNRAKVVLSSAKLRREYDLVGLDLEDDAEEENQNDGGGAARSSENGEGDDGGGGDASSEDAKEGGGSSKTETVMGHLASATLAAVLQVVVRTGLMGLVSVLVSRYTLLTFLAIGLLAFLTWRMYATLKQALGPDAKLNLAAMKDVISPMIIALGIFCMYRGRRFPAVPTDSADNAVDGDGAAGETEYAAWSWTFLAGESLVMTCFFSNSFDNGRPRAVLALFAGLSFLLSLWLRGRFWRYATILGFECVVAVLVVMAFPVMEMVLESIVEEKMRKVGEKIRSHDVRMKELGRRKRAS